MVHSVEARVRECSGRQPFSQSTKGWGAAALPPRVEPTGQGAAASSGRLFYLVHYPLVETERQTESEEKVERRWEAAPAVLAVIGLQLVLALVSAERHWKLWRLPWWVWIMAVAPETILLVTLAWGSSRSWLERVGHRRNAAIALLGVISLENAAALVALVASLVSGKEGSGGQLLLEGLTIWGTNVIAYGLWFWGLDRGGPVRRRQPDPPPPDFQFPQMENPQLAAPGWHPRLLDYIYVSFTNSIAFSPTDAMPLSRWAKMLMLSESAVSAVSILLVTARAVNIFK
jgi:hypothetical protein